MGSSLVCCGCKGKEQEEEEAASALKFGYQPLEGRRVFCCDVYDGDTVKVLFQWRHGEYFVQSVRIRGIDTPERKTKNREEHRAALVVTAVVKKWVADRGSYLHLVNVGMDKYGRILAEVWGEIEEKPMLRLRGEQKKENLAEFLLSSRMAKPYLGKDKKSEWTLEELDVIR